jgi:signal transduction histidine kinase
MLIRRCIFSGLVSRFPRLAVTSLIACTVALSTAGAEPAVRPGTNVAFEARVTASHEVEVGMSPGALTDGRAYSLVHPRDPSLGKAFHYLIDLGKTHALDHISLRQRNDRWDINRFSRLCVELFDSDPDSGANPVWTAIDRADGSYPEAAEVDVLRAASGSGEFRGRYVRLSSDSPVPKSPQLAEVEVYETRTPRMVAARADGRDLAKELPLSVPPKTRRLQLKLEIPQPGAPDEQVYRWRLQGHHDEWQPARSLDLDTPCPPAGDYRFEAQAAHSDGTWDATTLGFSVKVRPPFTQTPAFRWLVGAAALLLGVQLSRSISRRRIAALEAQTALAEERSRIARDMHDEVGARLAQLAVLQDVFAREHPMPKSAQESVRQLASVARQAVASLDEVVWMVDPQNDTLASTAEHLAQYATDYLAPLKISCRLEAPIEWPKLEIRAQVRHELILAFKEALQNVIKHAAATRVTLTLRHEAGQFLVRLTDNGRGMVHLDPSAAGHDGLRNMSARLGSIDGTCEIQSSTTGGTTVELRVPLPPF